MGLRCRGRDGPAGSSSFLHTPDNHRHVRGGWIPAADVLFPRSYFSPTKTREDNQYPHARSSYGPAIQLVYSLSSIPEMTAAMSQGRRDTPAISFRFQVIPDVHAMAP